MNKFDEESENIAGVYSISKKIFSDERGYLERLFCATELQCWANRPIAQINRTFTAKKGTLRGLHFQYAPYAEAKLISCLNGRVLDIALDVRKGSGTFGHIFTIELNSELRNSVLLPEGIAHGFKTLTDNVEMLYLHSQPYSKNMEGGVNILDTKLGLKLENSDPIISARDIKLPFLDEIKAIDL